MSQGKFITFEGGEGTGKTTQSRLLSERLQKEGYDVVLTREPGGTQAGEALRDVFVSHEGQNWPLSAQMLFMFTARSLHYEHIIKPEIEIGKIVICDRFADSTLAYQGYALGGNIDQFESLKKMVLGDFEPDLTFMFDIDPFEGLIRASGRDNQEDTFEEKDISFHEKLRQAYLDIAENNPDRCHVIDAAEEIDTISTQIWDKVKEVL